MKKLLALLLAGLMLLSLYACGGGNQQTIATNETPSDETSEITTETPATETAPSIISKDEKITIGDLEFSITETEFVKNFNPNGNFSQYCSDGNVHFVVHTMFKNIGKTATRVPYSFLTLEYADGYIFNPADTYHYSFDTYSYVANADELPILSDAKPCQTYFEVPKEVESGTEPLIIHIYIGTEEYIYQVK